MACVTMGISGLSHSTRAMRCSRVMLDARFFSTRTAAWLGGRFRTRQTPEKSKPQEGDISTRKLRRSGRPKSTYSLTSEGRKISDEEIKEYLTELVCGEGFPYGYRKLTVCLREDYGLIINHKKVYRLCKELGILLPKRILETECYSQHEFQSFMEAYAEVSRYIEYYNRKRRHGSLGYMAPDEFHKAFMCRLMQAEPFVA